MGAFAHTVVVFFQVLTLASVRRWAGVLPDERDRNANPLGRRRPPARRRRCHSLRRRPRRGKRGCWPRSSRWSWPGWRFWPSWRWPAVERSDDIRQLRTGPLQIAGSGRAGGADREGPSRFGPGTPHPRPPLSAGRSDCPVRPPRRQLPAQQAWRRPSADCRAIAFCGVHFMAETADILANRPAATGPAAAASGSRSCCPTWPPAARWPTWPRSSRSKTAGQQLAEVLDTDDMTPVTYINSAASLKAFCGRHGGIVCTSRNARAVLEWSFARAPPRAVLSRSALGAQHGPGDGHAAGADARLGPARRRAGRQHGRGDPPQPGAACGRAIAASTRCSSRSTSTSSASKYPGIKILVHPECTMEVVDRPT